MGILEIKEVLQHWLRGRAKRLIARRLGLDVKTVRKYVRVRSRKQMFCPTGIATLRSQGRILSSS